MWRTEVGRFYERVRLWKLPKLRPKRLFRRQTVQNWQSRQMTYQRR